MTDRLVPADHATIGAALLAAGNGDRVLDSRGAGTYAEAGSAYSAKTNIQIINANGAAKTLAYGASYLNVGSGWTIGDATYGFAITNTVVGQSAVLIDSNATPKTGITFHNCDISKSAAGQGTFRVVAQGGNAATVTLNNCTVSHGGGLDAIEQTGAAGAVPTVTLNDCTIGPALRGVELAAPAPVLTARRCIFTQCSNAGVASNAGAVAGTWTIRECLSAGAGAGPLLDWNTTGAATLDVSGCTIICAASGIKRTSASAALGTIQDCWADTIEYLNGGLGQDYNGYRVLALGGAGANDVVTLADPGFVNAAGGDYNLLVTSSLINAGVNDGDATDLNGDTRVVGAAQDLGAYEYQPLNCGVDTVAQVDRQHLDVTMVATGGGTQIPTAADVANTALWGVSAVPVDATLAVLTAAVDAVDDYLLHVALNHPAAVGATVTVDTSAISTDAGGLCDDPGTGAVLITYDEGDDIPHRYVYPISVGPLSDDGESQ